MTQKVRTALDRRRRELDYTVIYIAKRTGWSTAKVSTIVTGKQIPQLDDIWKLMRVLQIPPERMAEFFPEPKVKKKAG